MALPAGIPAASSILSGKGGLGGVPPITGGAAESGGFSESSSNLFQTKVDFNAGSGVGFWGFLAIAGIALAGLMLWKRK